MAPNPKHSTPHAYAFYFVTMFIENIILVALINCSCFHLLLLLSLLLFLVIVIMVIRISDWLSRVSRSLHASLRVQISQSFLLVECAADFAELRLHT